MYSCESSCGNETAPLINNTLPDAFDIIHEDCESVFNRYRYLVDLTFNPSFAKKHNNVITADEAGSIILGLMPCAVTGGVHWFVNKLRDGCYLTVFNNDGIDKSVDGGEKQLPQGERTAVITINDNMTLTPLEGCAGITRLGGSFHVPMKAGEVFFARLSRHLGY